MGTSIRSSRDVVTNSSQEVAQLKASLREMAMVGERADPLVFGGRENIIEDVMQFARRLPPTGPRGNTVVIDGPPGAGKTALICEIARRLSREGASPILQLEPPSRQEVADIYAQLAAALAGAPLEAGRTTTRREAGLAFRPGGIGAVASKDETVAPPSIESPLAVDNLRAGKTWQSDERAVVFIDEIQNLTSNRDADECRLARALHTQDRIPVLLVCSGLSNSQDILWPRHLQNYFNACWTTLGSQDTPSLDSADLEAAMSLGDELREKYYADRIARAGLPIEVLAALQQEIDQNQSVTDYQAISSIGCAIDALSATTKQAVRHRFSSDAACFDKMLAVGIVSLDDRKRCVSPIPTLGEFILAEYAAGKR